MVVACFCGHTYETIELLSQCPNCGKPVAVPVVPLNVQAQMQAELDQLLAEHEPRTWEGDQA